MIDIRKLEAANRARVTRDDWLQAYQVVGGESVWDCFGRMSHLEAGRQLLVYMLQGNLQLSVADQGELELSLVIYDVVS